MSCVALSSSPLDDELGLEHRVEDLTAAEFVPGLSVERFDAAVLPRAPRVDEERLHGEATERLPDIGIGEVRKNGDAGLCGLVEQRISIAKIRW
jgi:hypothetical protein